MPVLTSAAAASWAAGAASRGAARGFHQRRLRPAASRATPAIWPTPAPRATSLVVAVNSDRSVRALAKGPDRPVTPEHERAELLAALAAVDAVVIFDEETPLAIVAAIQPDVLVKGADWADDAIVGREVVEARGGRVVRVALAPGYSTTTILDRVRAASGAG